MPRKNRRAPDEPIGPVRRPQSDADVWALVPGFDIRRLAVDKPYRCPGCDHMIVAGAWHLVVVPQDDPDDRRHWHTECWRRELHRTRGKPRPQS
jgi:hypothetical protein